MAALVFLVVVALLFLCTAVDRWLERRRAAASSVLPEPTGVTAVDPRPDPDDRDAARDPVPGEPPKPPEPDGIAFQPDPTGDGTGLSDEGQLAGLLLGGSLCPAEYRLAMADLAFEEDLRHPLVVPPDMRGA